MTMQTATSHGQFTAVAAQEIKQQFCGVNVLSAELDSYSTPKGSL